MTTVSVVIPTWNRSALLQRAIRSALEQTRPPLEVLVCDDGSTDDTEQAVRSIGDSRVIWLPGERAGRPAVPRNRGIAASRGEWVAFLDDDDCWLPEKLEIQVRETGSRRTAAVCSDAWRVRQDGVAATPLLGGMDRVFRFKELLTDNRVVCSSMVVRRDILLAAGGFPEDAGLAAMEDYALWLRVADMAAVAYCALPLLSYRDDREQSIRRDGIAVCEQRYRVLTDFLAWKRQRGLFSLNLFRAAGHLAIESVSRWKAGFREQPVP